MTIKYKQEHSERADIRQGSTYPENFIKIRPLLFELSVFKNYISWIQNNQIVIQITPKIESFLPFTFSDIS